MRPVPAHLRASLVLSGAGLVIGCAAPSPATAPSPSAATRISSPVRFVEAPAQAARSTFGKRPWWMTLDDRDLDRLVGHALTGNLGLREAGARVTAAEATLRQSHARLFPTLDAAGESSDRWSSGDDQARSSLGALFDWEADLFGRLRAARLASARDVQATRADLAGARLLLSTTVAEAYFVRSEQIQQLALLADQIEVGETLLSLTRFRFGQGQASIVDVLQQEEQLKGTRALVPEVEARVAALGYVLDSLLGRPPGGAPRDGRSTLPAPPPLPATGLPSDLLLRRPDLIAAQERLASLDARVAEALADQLPRLRISASSLLDHRDSSSLVSNLVASVVGPLFDAGARQAEVDRRRAELEGAVAAFGNRFLEALREVETALVNERKQSDRLQRQETQLASARRLLSETRNRYSKGLIEYLPVLAAVTTTQRLERDVVTTRRDRLSQRIALHRALGGPMD